jgi:DNA-binding GntR family transcriptional regulator
VQFTCRDTRTFDMTTPPPRPEPAKGSRLQREAAARIRALLVQRESRPGTHLPEIELSRQLRVSRTPVRGALALLADEGLLEFRPGRGFFLRRQLRDEDRQADGPLDAAAESLSVAIARDRLAAALDDEMSEADLMRRYGVTRATLIRVLRQLADAGMVERKRGHGWSFLPALADASAIRDSYRFRMIVEPAGLLEPGFAPDADWLRSIRARHERLLLPGGERFSAVSFFEMNAEFHEGLARASGNSFLHKAVVQQNKLRRFVNYDWTYGPGRVEESVREHLAILDAVDAGSLAWAAALLRRHIEMASELDPKR